MYVEFEVEAAAEDVLAEQSHFFGLLDGKAQAFLCEEVFTADIEVTFVCAHGKCCNGHCFNDSVGDRLRSAHGP